MSKTRWYDRVFTYISRPHALFTLFFVFIAAGTIYAGHGFEAVAWFCTAVWCAQAGVASARVTALQQQIEVIRALSRGDDGPQTEDVDRSFTVGWREMTR